MAAYSPYPVSQGRIARISAGVTTPFSLFTPDGVLVENSVGATYRGRTLADPVRNYGAAFSNMHRELYHVYVDGNVVVVQLSRIL